MRIVIALVVMALGTRADAEGWSCTEAASAPVGTCKHDRDACEAFRSSLRDRVPDLSACTDSNRAACFGEGAAEHCAPSMPACEALRRAAGFTDSCDERDGAPEPSEPHRARAGSYAGALIGVDALCIGLTLGITCPIASPIVHLVEDHPVRAAASFVLHLAVPIALGVYADRTKPRMCNTGGDSGCDPFAGLFGFLAGNALVSALEVTTMASQAPATQATVVPLATGGGAMLVVAGRF